MIVDFPAHRPLLNSLLRNAIEALPLPVFLVCVQWSKPVVSADWRLAYFTSTAVAVATTVWVLWRQEAFNRIYLGLNLYFLSGSLGLAFEWQWLNEAYGRIEATGMLLWIVAVGVVSTLWSQQGFLVIDSFPKSRVRRESLSLLGIAACVTALSLEFRGNVLMSAYVPFIILFTAHSLLRATAKRRTQ